MSEELAERAERLARDLIAPLLLGGMVALQRPFGPRLALELGIERLIVDGELAASIDAARLRAARTVVAVDFLAPLGTAEWSMAAALNDLLQVTNHELSTFANRSRHGALCDATAELCARIAPCRNLAAALARHAVFSRALRVTRRDTEVDWWTGSRLFRGQPAPPRLLAWPSLRRVHVTTRTVALTEMPIGTAADPTRFEHALAGWLALSPLTDLATAARAEPRFAWSAHTLAVVADVPGMNLALRALRRETDLEDGQVAAAVGAMNASAASLRPGAAAQQIALRFATELSAANAYWDQAARDQAARDSI